MRARIAAGAFLLAAYWSFSASALTGLELQQDCQDQTKSDRAVACIAYIRGFTDGFFTATSAAKQGVRACLPTGGLAVEQEVRHIVMKHMSENSRDLHNEAGLLAMAAMVSAFPCR